MFLTFYTTKNEVEKITFKDILLNPYLKAPEIHSQHKKITLEITEEYGEKLYNKKNIDLSIYLDLIRKNNFLDITTENHYKHFTIPKKSDPNKRRPIDAPDAYLKNAQLIIKQCIEDCLLVLPHNAAHAYVSQRSTVTAMQKHKDNNSKWFLQIDLKNFFNSIDRDFLEEMLLKVYPFKFIDKTIFDAIIKLALLNNELPQGSVLSPTLTNLVMVPIDKEITDTLTNYNKHHYVYTRYADDITISCKQKFDQYEIIDIILSIFKKYYVPFKINNEKTRFGSSAGRNFHLGIIINKDNKMSIGHRKNDKFRAMLFNFCTTGDEWQVKDIQKMLGLISYYKSIEQPFVENTINKYNSKFNINIIERAKYLIRCNTSIELPILF